MYNSDERPDPDEYINQYLDDGKTIDEALDDFDKDDDEWTSTH